MANAAQQVLTNLRVQTTYKLQYPIALPDGRVIETLDVRRPKGKDFRLLDEKGFDPEKRWRKNSTLLYSTAHHTCAGRY